MSKTPFYNALAAVAYITLVAWIMFFGSQYGAKVNQMVAFMALTSLFTLSAAIMGYLFLYHPIQLYFDDRKKEAVNLFLKTVAYFGGITIILFILLFSGIFA